MTTRLARPLDAGIFSFAASDSGGAHANARRMRTMLDSHGARLAGLRS